MYRSVATDSDDEEGQGWKGGEIGYSEEDEAQRIALQVAMSNRIANDQKHADELAAKIKTLEKTIKVGPWSEVCVVCVVCESIIFKNP